MKTLRPTRPSWLLILALLLAVAVSACGTVLPGPTATETPAEPAVTRTPIPSLTPFPTETPRPSQTPLPSDTPTAWPSATPTPDAALSEVELVALAWYDDYDMLLHFRFPGEVRAEDYRVTLEGKEYNCHTESAYPDRLLCKGQGARVLAVADVAVYAAGQTQPGFEKEVWVPYFSNNYADVPK